MHYLYMPTVRNVTVHPSCRIVDVRGPSSPISNKKPPPSERPLLRAQTVGSGLGFNRQSKKAMLLRWCQRETVDYEVRERVLCRLLGAFISNSSLILKLGGITFEKLVTIGAYII